MSKQLIKSDAKKADERARLEGGFSLLQLLITVTIMILVGAFALMSISSARANMRLAGSARQFAAYVEKARIDAVRRHVSSASPTKIEFLDANSYRVTMDFDGSGIITSRVFDFNEGVSLLSLSPQPITFDWRGRMASCTASFSMVSSQSGTSPVSVDVTASGDVTVDSDIDDMPSTINYTNVNKTTDISSDATVKGTTAAPVIATTDCSALDAGSTAGVSGTGTCGTISVNPGKVSIKRNGGGSGSFTVTVTSSALIAAGGTSNLTFTPSSMSVSPTTASTFIVKSINRATGDFPVTFSSPCATASVVVRVTK
ncbi:MAG TPA: hypothetical protein VF553_02955 [Pyrinomonadaceae bacterium]|jgi:hypothetical protein